MIILHKDGRHYILQCIHFICSVCANGTTNSSWSGSYPVPKYGRSPGFEIITYSRLPEIISVAVPPHDCILPLHGDEIAQAHPDSLLTRKLTQRSRKQAPYLNIKFYHIAESIILHRRIICKCQKHRAVIKNIKPKRAMLHFRGV